MNFSTAIGPLTFYPENKDIQTEGGTYPDIKHFYFKYHNHSSYLNYQITKARMEYHWGSGNPLTGVSQLLHEVVEKCVAEIPVYRKKSFVLRATFTVITDSYHCMTRFSWVPTAIISANKKKSLFSELHLIYHFCFSHPAHMVLSLNKSRLASFFIQTLLCI